jgi:transposase
MKIDDSIELSTDSEIHQHNHLPLVASFCRKLGLIDLINTLVPSKMNISPGHIVQAMVLDTLSGRSPLYRLEEFMEEQDTQLLLGTVIPASKFNDTNVGRSMDTISKIGVSNILTELGHRAIDTFQLDARIVSYDTTSTNVWGDYENCSLEPSSLGPNITYGYSKDKRPDLKQFMTELICVERGIPIFGRNLDGNSSDKTSNNEMLTRISSIMAKNGIDPGAFLYVADSAMVSEDNLKALGDNLFITRLPATYSECGKAIGKAITAGDWTDIGILAETKETKNRLAARYKGQETTVELYGKEYRAIVIHSSAHDSRRQKKILKSLNSSEKQIQKKLKKVILEFSCEQDATKAMGSIVKVSTKLHRVAPRLITEEVKKRGRPPKSGDAPKRTIYRIEYSLEENSEEISRLKNEAGCFVLISNAPSEGEGAMTIKGILQTYKKQYGVESAFAFLKDPLIVNDTFLKNANRIDVLGMVLIIALMVWRLMERNMRAHVEITKKEMPALNKQTSKKPTAYMMTIHVKGVMVLVDALGKRSFLSRPKDNLKRYLEALGVDENVFTDPEYQCRPIIPPKLIL